MCIEIALISKSPLYLTAAEENHKGTNKIWKESRDQQMCTYHPPWHNRTQQPPYQKHSRVMSSKFLHFNSNNSNWRKVILRDFLRWGGHSTTWAGDQRPQWEGERGTPSPAAPDTATPPLRVEESPALRRVDRGGWTGCAGRPVAHRLLAPDPRCSAYKSSPRHDSSSLQLDTPSWEVIVQFHHDEGMFQSTWPQIITQISLICINVWPSKSNQLGLAINALEMENVLYIRIQGLSTHYYVIPPTQCNRFFNPNWLSSDLSIFPVPFLLCYWIPWQLNTLPLKIGIKPRHFTDQWKVNFQKVWKLTFHCSVKIQDWSTPTDR